jgi:transposase-like protein
MNNYHNQRIPGPFEASALRHACKKNSSPSDSSRESDPNSSQSLADWISSWWRGKETLTPQKTPILEPTVQASVIDALENINKLDQQEQADIIFNAVNQTPANNSLSEMSLSTQLEQGSASLEIVKDTTLVHLISALTLDLNRIESGELTQLSIAYQDNEGLIKLWHIDLNYLFSEHSAEILTQLLMQRFHLGQGTLFLKATSPMQAAALDLLVSSGRLLETPLDWQRACDTITLLGNHNDIETNPLKVMPYAGELIIPNMAILHNLSKKYVLSQGSELLTDIPKRVLGFLATYILASNTLADPILIKGLLLKHPELHQNYLLPPHDPMIILAPLLDSKKESDRRLLTNSLGDQNKVAQIVDLDDYIQDFQQLLVGQMRALVYIPGTLSEHQNALQSLASLIEINMIKLRSNPCHQELIQTKLEIKKAIDEAETVFANRPSIWHKYVMPVMNRVIEFLNQCLKVFCVPKAYHFTLFKPAPTAIQNAWSAFNIKSALLDEEKGLISKIDSILTKNNSALTL